jgi:hypothetical protein
MDEAKIATALKNYEAQLQRCKNYYRRTHPNPKPRGRPRKNQEKKEEEKKAEVVPEAV